MLFCFCFECRRRGQYSSVLPAFAITRTTFLPLMLILLSSEFTSCTCQLHWHGREHDQEAKLRAKSSGNTWIHTGLIAMGFKSEDSWELPRSVTLIKSSMIALAGLIRTNETEVCKSQRKKFRGCLHSFCTAASRNIPRIDQCPKHTDASHLLWHATSPRL